MRKKNKGFTLIEMIVTVAIIAIFSGVVLTFVSTGANSYRNTSNNSEVQMETQQALDQIQNLVIDANRSVYYAKGELGSVNDTENEIKSDIGSDTDGMSQKHFIVCNEKEKDANSGDYIWDIISWDPTSMELSYQSRSKEYSKSSASAQSNLSLNSTGEEPAATASSEDNPENDLSIASSSDPQDETLVGDEQILVEKTVLAHNIVSFCADVTKVESERIVRFRLVTDVNGKKIETLHTVNLRNRISVQPPELDLEELPTENAKIIITNARDLSSDCGSYMFAKSMIGDVLPDTVVWSVEDAEDGCSFPPQDPTNGNMTIDPSKPQRQVTVTVTARTLSGGTVTDSKTITIIKSRQPVSLIPSTTSLILGVGNTYNLKDLVQWQITYSDGSTQNLDSVTWSGQIGNASVNSDGSVTIPGNLGNNENDSVYSLSATASIDGVKLTSNQEVIIQLARLDILKPSEEYSVGDSKPFEYSFKIGGKEKNVKSFSSISVTKANDSTITRAYTYGNDVKFTNEDVGSWTLKAEVNLSNDVDGVKGYGTVLSSGAFEVKDGSLSGSGNILINQTETINTVVSGRTYQCAPTVNWGFNFWPSDVSNPWENYTIDWSIEGNPQGISISNTDNGNATLTVASSTDTSHPAGFKLCATYTKYTDSNHSAVLETRSGYKEVNVAYGIDLQPVNGTTAYVGEDYLMSINLKVAQYNGNDIEIPINSQGQDAYVTWERSHGSAAGSVSPAADGIHWFYVAPDWAAKNQQPINIEAHLQRMGGLFDPNNNFDFFSAINVTVQQPESTARINYNGELTINEGQEKTKNLSFSITDRNGQSISQTVNWTVNNNGHLSHKTSNTGETVTFSADNPGKYIITVHYASNGQPKETSVVIKVLGQVSLEICGKDTLYVNEQSQYYLNVNNQVEEIPNLNVQWTFNGENPGSANSISGENGKITFNAPQNPGTVIIVAKVTVNNQEYQCNKSINIVAKNYNITAEIKGPDSVYRNSVNQYWLDLKINGVAVSDKNVTWIAYEGKLDKNNTNSGSQTPVTYTAPDYEKNYIEVSAKIVIDNVEFTYTKNIQVKNHEINVEIKARNQNTKQDINSLKVAETAEIYLIVRKDGVITTDYTVELYCDGGNCSVSTDNSNKIIICTPQQYCNSLSFRANVTINGQTTYNSQTYSVTA